MEKNLKDFMILLETKIKESDGIFVVPHFQIDFDAIGAAVGMVKICDYFQKKANIVMDDSVVDLNKGVPGIYDTILKQYTVLPSKDIDKYRTSNDLMITVDVNKVNLLPPNLQSQIGNFSNMVVLDHHKEDENSIPTSDKYIDTNTSSTCEMMARLFKLCGIPIDQQLANYFLAGIYLDTNRLQNVSDAKTFYVVGQLIRKGASTKDIDNLFVADFKEDRKIHHLIDGTEFIRHDIHNVAIVWNSKSPSEIYSKVELAKAANYLLQFKVDAVYALGMISENEIGISARTFGNMDIAEVMHTFGGGGNYYSAAAKVIGTQDVSFVRNELQRLIEQPKFYTVNSQILTEKSQEPTMDEKVLVERKIN